MKYQNYHILLNSSRVPDVVSNYLFFSLFKYQLNGAYIWNKFEGLHGKFLHENIYKYLIDRQSGEEK